VKFIKLIFVMPLLAACTVNVDQVTPAVSQFNGDSVSIQLDNGLLLLATEAVRQAAYQKADQEAERICRKGPKKRAEFTSSRTFSTGQYTSAIERLYLCLN